MKTNYKHLLRLRYRRCRWTGLELPPMMYLKAKPDSQLGSLNDALASMRTEKIQLFVFRIDCKGY